MGWTPEQIDKMDFKMVELFKLIMAIENCEKPEEIARIVEDM